MCLIGAIVYLLAAPWVQLSVSAGNGWYGIVEFNVPLDTL